MKLTKTNQIILYISLILEFVFLNYFLATNIGITIFSRLTSYIRLIVIDLGFNLIYFFYLLDSKKDNNFKLIITYPILTIIKALLVYFFLNKYTNIYNIITFTILELFSLIIFYILYILLPKKDNQSLKIIKFKRNPNLFNYILIKDNLLSSTFDFNNNLEYSINKNNFYIKDKELDKYQNKKDIILKNTLVVVSGNINDYSLYKNKVIYFVLVSNTSKPSYKKGLRIVSKDINLLEYIENLLSIDKLYYIQEDYLDLVSKSKYYFQEKMKLEHSNLPSDDFLLELYKNAYLTDSAYQSILILLNYIVALTKMILYYLYNKYHNNKEIVRELVIDSISITSKNIYRLVKKDDLIYDIKSKTIKLSDEERNYLNYMSNFLGVKLEGDSLSFLGLFKLIRLLRNKVEAHGSINDSNVYVVWYLFYIFTSKLNIFLKANNLHYERQKEKVLVWYDNSNKVDLGDYLLFIDNELCYIFPKLNKYKSSYLEDYEKTYLNYFNGNQMYKPNIVKEKKNK